MYALCNVENSWLLFVHDAAVHSHAIVMGRPLNQSHAVARLRALAAASSPPNGAAAAPERKSRQWRRRRRQRGGEGGCRGGTEQLCRLTGAMALKKEGGERKGSPNGYWVSLPLLKQYTTLQYVHHLGLAVSHPLDSFSPSRHSCNFSRAAINWHQNPPPPKATRCDAGDR